MLSFIHDISAEYHLVFSIQDFLVPGDVKSLLSELSLHITARD